MTFTGRTALAMLAVLAGATACDRPDPVSAAAPEQPRPPAAPESRPPPPPVPAWAGALLGKKVETAFPVAMKCIGVVDGVAERYKDARSIVGWAWNESGGRPIERVVAVNRQGSFVGFGTGGERRPDLAAKVGAPSDRIGWTLFTAAPAKNGVRIYGIDMARKRACLLGHTPVPA